MPLKRKKLSEAQCVQLDHLATFLTEEFERRCALIRAGDRMAIRWHQLRLAYNIRGDIDRDTCRRHLEEIIYR